MKILVCTLTLVFFSYCFPFHPKQQFTSDFKLWTQYNASLSFNDATAAQPFIWSDPLSPLQGKMYFDWTQQGFRFDLTAGPGAPYDFESTIIVHPTDFVVKGSLFNVTWDIYEYLSDGRCWYQTIEKFNLPVEIDQLDPNITFVSIETVDGFTCAVFNSSTGSVYAVRISDLAIIRAQTPYIGEIPLPIPIFLIGGGGNDVSWIDMYNPVIGPIDPSYFAVPSGKCIYLNGTVFQGARDMLGSPADWVSSMMKRAVTPVPEKPKVENPKVENQKFSSPPPLAQAFSAKFLLTVLSIDYPPYQPYNITGKIAFDFGATGLYGMINSVEGALPFNLQAGFIIYPNKNGFELLFVSPEGECYSIFFFQWLWSYLLPPYQLPPDANYAGETVINGDKCSIWNYGWDRSITVYIREKDNAIVKAVGFTDPTWTDNAAVVVLTDIDLNVDPSIYSRPPKCSDTIVWNPSFQSHLPWYWCSPICTFVDPMSAILS